MKFIISPIATEKTMLSGQKENKLAFYVNKNATKKDVKSEIEELFNVKVVKVNILRDKKGKKAVVRLSEDYNAEEIGERIGLY